MATTPEGRIKRRLDKMLKEEGVWFYSPQAGPFGVSGIPDRVACVLGRFVGIECKADKTKKPTALQEKCMRDIEAAGGKCFVAYDDETIAAVRDYIKEIKGARNPTVKGVGTKAQGPGEGSGDGPICQDAHVPWD
jgi:hypothetical protein